MSEALENALKTKEICRFCLTQTDKLSNIYSKECRLNHTAPLPLEIMACCSIEVFTNDGMPPYVCNPCRLTFEHCYRFKQMCKKADTALRQYPLTGKWPNQLDHPEIPSELLPQPSGYEDPPTIILNSYPIEDEDEEFNEFKPNSIIFNEEEDRKPQLISIVNKPSVKFMAKRELITTPTKKRLLNKQSVKILNKEATKSYFPEPIMTAPVMQTNIDGNLEIVSKILDSEDKAPEPDPIKTAVPIQTNVFPCSQCERSFPLKQLLDMHMHRHLRERNFDCDQCEKSFFSKYDLGKHMMTHTGEKPFKCVACGKAFSRSTLLHRHEKSHTDVSKFLCVFCEKPFISEEEMKKHAERHKKHRPFACSYCDKSFAFKQGLERHETIHSRQQPYPCQYCNLSFSTPSKLARHLTAHAGKRPYPCKLCKKSYHLSHHLTRHMRSHKAGQSSYKCVECSKVFNTRDDLIYHSAVHATQSLTCPLCKEQFESVDDVTEHVKQHGDGEQFACEFCDLIFMTDDKLILHCAASHALEMAEYSDENEDKSNTTTVVNEAGDQGVVVQEFLIDECGELNPKNHEDDLNYENQLFQELMDDEQPSTSTKSVVKLKEVKLVKSAKPVKVVKSIKVEKLSPNDKKRERDVSPKKQIVIKSPPEKKLKASPGISKSKEVIEMTIGDKKVKVQKISVSKSEADAMAKAGRIQMKDGALILSKGKSK